MLLDEDLKGVSLPPRTLCLTYDDGPGPETRALGEYLHAEGIPAAFFVIGQLAEREPQLLDLLRSWGHLVGSHTYRHAGLIDLVLSGGDVVDELARADVVLRGMSRGRFSFGRPMEAGGGRPASTVRKTGLRRLSASACGPAAASRTTWVP